MSSVSKKKTSGRKKSFSSECEDLYFVTEVGDKIQCLVCQQVKECNVRRHYETLHREKYNAYAGKIREDQVMKLKSALCKQRSFFTNVCQSSEDSVKASFARSEMIAKP